MTEPIELLEERLKEILDAENRAKRNQLDEEEMSRLQSIRAKYNVCINLLDLALRDDFVYKGDPVKASMELYIAQWKKIRYLKQQLAQKQ